MHTAASLRLRECADYCEWRGRAPSARSIANTVLDVQVAAIHAQSRRSYGRERIVRQLHMQGLSPGHERVRKSLLRQKLRPVYRRPYRVTTDSKHDKPIAANILNRRFEAWRINRAWVGDITYLVSMYAISKPTIGHFVVDDLLPAIR